MSFLFLSEEQSAIFAMANDFAAARIAPHALEWDEKKALSG